MVPKNLTLDDLYEAMKLLCDVDNILKKPSPNPMKEYIHSHVHLAYSFVEELRKELE